jgi:hypothetical protein
MRYLLDRPYLGLVAIASVLGIAVAGLDRPAAAQAESRISGAPVMAVVSLGRQKVTIYDARGKMLEAPVSTGQSGYETPAGLYTVIERNRQHYSNLYENAPMPFMQRITWSGIALHAGALPGYPASHGCIRLPYGFAERLYELSKRGMRVAVVRGDMAPVDFAHPALFKLAAPRTSLEQGDARIENAAFAPDAARRSGAVAKAAAAEAAAERARVAKAALSQARRDAGEYLDRLEAAEDAKRMAEGMIGEADEYLEMGVSPKEAERLKAAKSKAQDRLAAAQVEIDAVYAQARPKIDAVVAARVEAKAAREASEAAESEAKLAALPPVSVFISRKTQRLYVRQSFEPLFESGVTIRNPDAPIGTTLFTAIGYAGKGAGELRWSALAMYPNMHPDVAHPRTGGGRPPRFDEPATTDAAAARAALERIAIPRDALDRINELVAPGSSLIISDEAMSRETSKGTDFVVVMSGEPQGAISRRRLRPDVFSDYSPRSGPGTGMGMGFGPFSWW